MAKLKPGINEVTNSEYHGDKTYLSSSSLKLLIESPIKFYNKHIAVQDEYQSVGSINMDLGSFVHSLILEPETTNDEFVMYDGFKRGPAWGAFAAQNKGKTILNKQNYELGLSLAETIRNQKAAKELLVGGQSEFTYCTKLMDVDIKVRADYINLKDNYILDIKTTSKPLTKDALMGSIAGLHYDLSAALYIDCFKQINKVDHMDFYFIFVNTKDSLDVQVFKASHMLINNGRKKYKKAINIMNQCLKSGIWKSEEIEEIDVPFWSLIPDDI